MSQIKTKKVGNKVINVKTRRDQKRKRAKNMLRYRNKESDRSSFRQLLRATDYTWKSSDRYLGIYDSLISRQVEVVDFCKGQDVGSPIRLHDYSLALTQVYLHRALSLYVGAFQALASNNIYLMTLSIRGYLESVAGMGFLYKKLDSHQQGNIDDEALDKFLIKLLFGTKDQKLLDEVGNDDFTAINVMSMLDEADKAFNSKIMNGDVPDKKMLRTVYEWLCEFCHPNYDSASLSFELDKEKQVLVFKHNQSEVNELEGKLIQDVFIASYALLTMYDQVVVIAKSLK
ncbi:hypothetical protein [Vibrio campbellii]|uniref:hypothetical protein n=1 Tax=Vibrio campbellii TaxID=680 RepID=UPI000AA1359B|nr:hypothetical protein [Vibrio campbellii]